MSRLHEVTNKVAIITPFIVDSAQNEEFDRKGRMLAKTA
jgi:hypothetical protein